MKHVWMAGQSSTHSSARSRPPTLLRRKVTPNLQTRHPTPDTRYPTPDTQKPESDIRNPKHETLNVLRALAKPELETWDPKPRTRNPKPKTLDSESQNPTPEIRNLGPDTLYSNLELRDRVRALGGGTRAYIRRSVALLASKSSPAPPPPPPLLNSLNYCAFFLTADPSQAELDIPERRCDSTRIRWPSVSGWTQTPRASGDFAEVFRDRAVHTADVFCTALQWCVCEERLWDCLQSDCGNSSPTFISEQVV